MKKLFMAVIALMMTISASAQFYIYYSDGTVAKVDSISMIAPAGTDTPDTPIEPEEPTTPSAGIGVFSVAEGKTVTFSPGNLQYTQSTNTWSFAENQYDYIGTDNVIGGSVSSDPTDGDRKSGTALADKVDLFGWSTNTTYYGVSTSTYDFDYSGSFVDWGTNQIGDDAPNTWRTLSKDEWYYLLNTRANADSLCGVAQVNGVNGLIFLPDDWTCPPDVTFKSGFHRYFGEDYYAAYQSFTTEQWSKLEKTGAVFLPAAGERNGTNVYVLPQNGFYWTSTKYDDIYSYSFGFYSNGASLYVDAELISLGRPIRLVKDLSDNTPDNPNQPETAELCLESADERAVFFQGSELGTSANVYMWIRGTYTDLVGAWPGSAATPMGDGTFKFVVPASVTSSPSEWMIIWNGNGVQTDDLDFVMHGIYNFNGCNGTVTALCEGGEVPTPDPDPEPEQPETGIEIKNLKYAAAVYVEDAEYGDYWAFDLYNDYDYDAEDYVYPELYVMVNEAYSKTAINGTYNVLYSEYLPTAYDLIITDEVGTLTIKNVDSNGNYSFKGSFIANDGKTYTFNQTVEVYAYSYAEEDGVPVYEEIILNEGGTTPENPDPEDPNPEDPQDSEMCLNSADERAVFFQGEEFGTSANVYMWDPANDNKELVGSWPGSAATPMGDGTFKFVVPANVTSSPSEWMIIWNGNGVQTDDLDFVMHGLYNMHGCQGTVTALCEENTPDEPANNGHEYVDLGLSVKWATCNVGASKPEEYGDYFAWGEVEPKDTYDWGTYKYGSSYASLTKYNNISSYGTVDNKTTLELSDDAARVNWGGAWRMPTDAELTELREQCTWTWTTQNGVNGYKVTSKTNGNSIFLPAAGNRNGSSLRNAGSSGVYGSGSLNTDYPYSAWYGYFNSSYVSRDHTARCYGFSVRPVCP